MSSIVDIPDSEPQHFVHGNTEPDESTSTTTTTRNSLRPRTKSQSRVGPQSLFSRISPQRKRRSRKDRDLEWARRGWVVKGLVGLWLVLLTFGEILASYISVWTCPWPVHGSWDLATGQPYHIAVIADPQLADIYSYGQSGITLQTYQYYTDLYMSRALTAIRQNLNPDAYVFLGNLFDNGFRHSKAGWEAENGRFQKIFTGDKDGATPRRIYVGGNRDYGLGDRVNEEAKSRFRIVFGNGPFAMDLGNHTVFGIDSPSVAGNAGRVQSGAERELEDLLEKYRVVDAPPVPRIVLTHIPLYRPENSTCIDSGSTFIQWSSSEQIVPGSGTQSQNLLDEEWSTKILTMLKPSLILSGDHHKYCNVAHNETQEHTIATFSFLQDNIQPQFALLSLYNPTGFNSAPDNKSPTFLLKPCALPIQFLIFGLYAFAFLVTLTGVLISTCIPRAAKASAIIRQGHEEKERVRKVVDEEAGNNAVDEGNKCDEGELERARDDRAKKRADERMRSIWKSWVVDFATDFLTVSVIAGSLYGIIHFAWYLFG